jgi:hypothetical protein
MKPRDLAMVDLDMAFSCHPRKTVLILTFCKCVDWSSTAFELEYVSTLLGKAGGDLLGKPLSCCQQIISSVAKCRAKRSCGASLKYIQSRDSSVVNRISFGFTPEPLARIL